MKISAIAGRMLCLSLLLKFGTAFADITVGGHSEFDACQTLGEVAGKVAVTLRDAPRSNAKAVAQLQPKQNVLMCEEKGSWTSVVVVEENLDCGVSVAIEKRQTYHGKCKAGWLPTKIINGIAG